MLNFFSGPIHGNNDIIVQTTIGEGRELGWMRSEARIMTGPASALGFKNYSREPVLFDSCFTA